jgi:hypothetical protein
VVADHDVWGDIENSTGGASDRPSLPDEADWWDRYEILQCCGCETISVMHTRYFAPLDEKTVSFYPPRVSRREPEWSEHLPVAIRSLIGEVYTALAADSRRLAVMGARTVVDTVIAEKVGDLGPFRQKLESLESQGYIGKANREHLAVALDAGSAVAHRGHVPSSEAVEHVMNIVENLLEAVYVLGTAADSLSRETPPRWPSKR